MLLLTPRGTVFIIISRNAHVDQAECGKEQQPNTPKIIKLLLEE